MQAALPQDGTLGGTSGAAQASLGTGWHPGPEGQGLDSLAQGKVSLPWQGEHWVGFEVLFQSDHSGILSHRW